MPHNFLLFLYFWDPMTLLKGHAAFFSGCAMHRVGRKYLPASNFSSAWHVCFPRCGEGCGVHRLPSAGASTPGPSTRFQDPIPSFWQLSGLGWPRRGLDDLTAVPSASWGPVFLSLSGAHPGCRAEGPLSFRTRGSRCLVCASTWQRLLNQEALCLWHLWLPACSIRGMDSERG